MKFNPKMVKTTCICLIIVFVTPALHLSIYFFVFSFDPLLAIAFGGWVGLSKLSLKGTVS